MSENPPSEKDMRCYEEDTAYVQMVFKENEKWVYQMWGSMIIACFILYMLFRDTASLFTLISFILGFIALVIMVIYTKRDRKKYSYINRICFDEHGMHIDFYLQSLFIPFEDILYIYPPKNKLGNIAYLLKPGKRGKRNYKELWMSGDLFYIINNEIINYFKAKGGRPPFLVVMPEERASMRNTVVRFYTYALGNKKKKMDRILEKFWSKHTLEEFE